MSRLTLLEQETIINFNKAEATADIYTYEKTWQKHLEGKMGLKPIADDGIGGKTYRLPKDRIKMPRAKRTLSAQQIARLRERAKKMSEVSNAK